MQIVYHGTPDQFRRHLAQLLLGQAPDTQAIARALQLRLGNVLLSQIYQDFITKSRGGTGRDGVRWPPLQPETIARRRRSKGDVAAGKRARKAAKRAGQKRPTNVDLYGGRQVDILRDTTRLMRSLTPGVDDRPSGEADQVFQVLPGRVIVGSNVPYADAHQNGNPAKNLPARPIVPPGNVIPPAYQSALDVALERGVAQAIRLLAGSGGAGR